MPLTITKEDFEVFVADKGYDYPYLEVARGENCFFCNWLMLVEGPKHVGDSPRFQPVPSSFFGPDTVTYLIISEEAFPMTPDMCEVMQFTATFGDDFGHSWTELINYFGGLLLDEDNIRVKARKFVLKEVISMRIDSMMDEPIAGDRLSKASKAEIYSKWRTWFTDFYADMKTFRRLASASVQFVIDAAKEAHSLSAQSVRDNDTILEPEEVDA